MKEELILRTSMPPSVNHYYGRTRQGRMFVGKRGIEFRAEVKNTVSKLRDKPIDGKLSIDINLYPPDRRRRDVDNILKCMLDALQHGGAYDDDSAITRLAVIKHEPADGGYAIVCITTI